jgi:hypothetical protein
MRGLFRSWILIIKLGKVEWREFQIHVGNPFLARYALLALLFFLGLLLAPLQPSPLLLPFLRT